MENEDSSSHLYFAQENGTSTVKTPLIGGATPVEHGEDGTSSYQKQNLSFVEETSVGNMSSLHGRFLLLVVAFLYGSLNVTLRLVYDLPGPPSASALSTSRGWLAAACFLPLLARHRPGQIQNVEAPQASFWRVAAELALFNFGAQGLLTLGLLSTESARASFLTQTSVVITPLISAVAGHHVQCRVWIGCLIALVGLIVLSNDGAALLSFGIGDLLCMAGAVCWSCYLFRLSAIGDAFDEISLQAAKTFFLALLYSAWFLCASVQSDISLWPGWTNPVTWVFIFYSAIGPGTFADIVQQKGQATVSAAEANVILSLEPVFTAILGLLFLGEATTWQEKCGGGLIIIASVISTKSD
jgi:drug/metabolite transporter (DMT)-like permease